MALEEPKEVKASSTHEAIIKRVYYDVKSGFGSIAKTLKKAQESNSFITRDEVSAFLAKQEHRQSKRRRKDNSYVPFGPRE